MDPIGFHAHDHSHCINDGIAVADAHCRAHGLQFTPVRRRVLEILLQAHRAMGAYDLLDILRDEGLGSQPPIAYRALDFLVKNGFVHKIEQLNAFVACSHPGDDHAPVFMICRTCNAVAEAPSQTTNGRLGTAAREAGFLIERTVMEAEGLCPKCQQDDAQ
ncbi:transcriptional repressor [Phaeobacter sp. A36a-5a]|uniref:transcriptional repressor n=1 Tax=Phaeobacter bryozoorum TaxID=1086632 RepID=UPI0035A5C0D3